MQERANNIYDVLSMPHDTRKNIEDNKDHILPWEMIISTDTKDLLYKDEQGEIRNFFGAGGDINQQIKDQVDQNTVNIQGNAEAIEANVKEINNLKLDKLDRGSFVGSADDLLDKGGYIGTANDLNNNILQNRDNILLKLDLNGGKATNLSIEQRSPYLTFSDTRDSEGKGGYVGCGTSAGVVQLVNKKTERELRLDSDGKLKYHGNELVDFSKYRTSLSINGYTSFPNGLIIQKGVINMASVPSGSQTEYVVNFPIAFTSGNDYVVLTETAVAFSADRIFTNHHSKNSANVTIRCSQTSGSAASSILVDWIAVGY